MHNSPHVPTETEYVASLMADAGFPDDYIGAILMYHYHDHDVDDGTSVEVMRDSGKKHGVVIDQPSGPHYPTLIDGGQPARIEVPESGERGDVEWLLPEEES